MGTQREPAASWAFCAIRTLLVTLIAVAFAAGGHVAAGGELPAWWALVAMVLVCAAVTTRWFRAEASRTSVLAVLVIGQTVLHALMTVATAHGGSTFVDTLADALHHMTIDLVTDAPMVAAHLATAAMTGALLGQGERALWAVLRILARAAAFVALAFRPLGLLPVPLPSRNLRDSADAAPRRTALVVVSTHVRRGPPALLAA